MNRRVAFGSRLKAIRKDRGYSQERLAEMACLHRTYVGGVERGERNVSLVNIWRIADALEINPSVLFAGPREPILAETPRRISSTALVGKDVPRKDRLWTKSRKQ